MGDVVASDPAVAVEAVTFGYGAEPVVRDVSFAVGCGEFVGIIGPNGSGKSTLLKLMSGYLRPWQGRVAVEGEAVERMSRAALGRRIAVVPQDTAVTLPFTVMEMVLLGRTPHGPGFGFEDERDLAAARRAMERTDTLQLAGRRVTELSGGERQRVDPGARAGAGAAHPPARRAGRVSRHPPRSGDVRPPARPAARRHDGGQRPARPATSPPCTAIGWCCSPAGGWSRVGTPAEVITYPTLTAVYGTEVYVTMNDVTGALNVLPLSREHRERLRRQFGSAGAPRSCRRAGASPRPPRRPPASTSSASR